MCPNRKETSISICLNTVSVIHAGKVQSMWSTMPTVWLIALDLTSQRVLQIKENRQRRAFKMSEWKAPCGSSSVERACLACAGGEVSTHQRQKHGLESASAFWWYCLLCFSFRTGQPLKQTYGGFFFPVIALLDGYITHISKTTRPLTSFICGTHLVWRCAWGLTGGKIVSWPS